MENVEDIYPLSPMQQGMLFHTLYTPGSTVYFQQFHWSLRGNLQVAALEKSWQGVLERHPALRTVFVWEGLEQPVQVVRTHVTLPWHFHDWRQLKATDQSNRLATFLEADREQGFDLTKSPLMRLHLIQLDNDRYHFVWSHHHLLLDGWSLPLILQEVFTLYEAYSHGQEIHLPLVPPYREYIAWLEQRDKDETERFWRSKLQGFESTTSFAGRNESQKPLDWTGNYKEQVIRLSSNATYALRSFAQQHRITVSTLVQGAWALLLSCYSEREDVLFGATVSGRPPDLAGIESMVGMFINTLPVRVQIQTDKNLITWLQDLQQQLMAQEQYAYTPLTDIQGWSDIPRGKSLFESIIVFENYPMNSPEELTQLEVGPIEGFEKTNYPLTLTVEPGSRLLLHMDYDGDRFDADRINRMLAHLQTLIEAIVTEPDQLIGDLVFLTGEERQQLVEWNNTVTEFSLNKCVHQLFEAQVERTPAATAVTWDKDTLTYDQLNRKANQLAHFLRRQGIEPEVPVVIYLDRSLEQIVSILAVLKAGGVYIPIDTLYPADRIGFMLEDVQPRLILTQDALLQGQSPVVNYPTLCLDSDWATIAKESEQTPENKTLPHHLAYIIYTSGSTGQPKGVMVEHQNLVNAYFAWEKAYELHAVKAHLQMANFTFDVFVGDLVRSLLSGGKLVLCPRELLLMPKDLYTLLREEQVDCAEFVPVALRHLIEYLEQSGQTLDFMRLIACGSDYWYVNEYQRTLSFCGPNTRLINSYGLTETTIDSTYFEWKALGQGDNRLVPIGLPFANMQIFILDKKMHPIACWHSRRIICWWSRCSPRLL
jgi:amino acid adenylation domain-containing protein